MSVVVEVDYFNICKHGQKISGDVFLLDRDKTQNRIVCTLSDGLGSGVKANVLANLTATMGQRFVLNSVDITRAAKKIMMTLPVCSERKISYATFSIMDISDGGRVRVIEYDNPLCILHRGGKVVDVESEEIPLESRIGDRKEQITYSEIDMLSGDRLLFFSDGVSQSGMGTASFPLGWRRNDLIRFVNNTISDDRNISARDLSRAVVRQGRQNDCHAPKDDITCGVVYFRKPRHTLIVTGAPMKEKKDSYLGETFKNFEGKKIISGGTTASIIGRELDRPITVDLSRLDKKIPPQSIMDGADLVSEGMLTLSRVVQILENREDGDMGNRNAATDMVDIFLDSDRVHFIVGTKINEAHQNPDMPVEMGIRRTIVQRIIRALEENYLKETSLEYL